METTIYIIINFVAVFGNILVCSIFFRNSQLRSVTYLYVLALAISDVALATFCMPLVWGVLLVGEWRYSSTLCGMHGFAVLFLASVSMHTISLLAFNRYCRVVKPWLFRRIFSTTFLVGSVLGVILMAAFFLGLPLAAGWAFFHFHSGKITCVLEFHHPTTDKVYTSLLGLEVVLIPFAIITFCYIKVFLKVQRHRRRFPSTSFAERSAQGWRLSVEEINITTTLFAIVLGFTVCWLPVFVIEFVDSITGNHSLPRRVYLVTVFLVSVSAAINPIIYGMLNKTFRAEYCKMYRSCRTSVNVFTVQRQQGQNSRHAS